ncbi:MAG: cbb3-type cytochrome oxidase assembly protein CcoS [Candidatus Macondimonas sp.]|jgi:cbb3-type cytochrome oxidase maturation protein
MNALFLLIPLSLVLVGLAVALFFWAVHAGQFDDLDSPAYRILLDDSLPAEPEEDRTPP